MKVRLFPILVSIVLVLGAASIAGCGATSTPVDEETAECTGDDCDSERDQSQSPEQDDSDTDSQTEENTEDSENQTEESGGDSGDGSGDSQTEEEEDAETDTDPDTDPVAEICDGIDNDIDGEVDEGFDAGDACSVGIGVCLSNGTMVCSDDGTTTECNVAAGIPAEDDSSCNGIDNDCDGNIDEDYSPVATACGVGQCAASGVTSCVGGVVQDSCSSGAPAVNDSSCDNIDDDGNGNVDENYKSEQTFTLELYKSKDSQEARDAFVEKRDADFKDED